jgi:hypothetical protein
LSNSELFFVVVVENPKCNTHRMKSAHQEHRNLQEKRRLLAEEVNERTQRLALTEMKLLKYNVARSLVKEKVQVKPLIEEKEERGLSTAALAKRISRGAEMLGKKSMSRMSFGNKPPPDRPAMRTFNLENNSEEPRRKSNPLENKTPMRRSSNEVDLEEPLSMEEAAKITTTVHVRKLKSGDSPPSSPKKKASRKSLGFLGKKAQFDDEEDSGEGSPTIPKKSVSLALTARNASPNTSRNPSPSPNRFGESGDGPRVPSLQTSKSLFGGFRKSTAGPPSPTASARSGNVDFMSLSSSTSPSPGRTGRDGGGDDMPRPHPSLHASKSLFGGLRRTSGPPSPTASARDASLSGQHHIDLISLSPSTPTSTPTSTSTSTREKSYSLSTEGGGLSVPGTPKGDKSSRRSTGSSFFSARK